MKQNKPTLTDRLNTIKQKFTQKQARSSDLEHPAYRRYAHIGLGIIVLFIGGFILWAGFTTLESAAVANGQIVAESKNKSIQHLEGVS